MESLISKLHFFSLFGIVELYVSVLHQGLPFISTFFKAQNAWLRSILTCSWTVMYPGGIGVSKAGDTKEHTRDGKWWVIHMLSIGLRQFHMCLRLPRSTQEDSVRFLLFYMRISLFPSSS